MALHINDVLDIVREAQQEYRASLEEKDALMRT